MSKRDQAHLEQLMTRERQLVLKLSRAEQSYCTDWLLTRHTAMQAVATALVILALVFAVSLIYSLVDQARTSPSVTVMWPYVTVSLIYRV